MNKSSIQNGLFLGVAMIICSYVLYLANPKMFLTAKGSILFLVFVLIMTKSGLDARKQGGGFIGFKSAFLNMFITGAIGTFCCTFFEYVHYNFLAPELIDMQREINLEAAEKMAELFSGLGDEYEEAMDLQLENLEDENFTSLGNTIKNYFVRLIFPVALLSAFIGLFIKRGKPFNPNDRLDDRNNNGPDDNEKRYIVNK